MLILGVSSIFPVGMILRNVGETPLGLFNDNTLLRIDYTNYNFTVCEMIFEINISKKY